MELAFRESLKKMRGTKSKEKFSQELEMSRSNYSRIESGKSDPTIKTLEQIAKLTNSTLVVDLIPNEPTEPETEQVTLELEMEEEKSNDFVWIMHEIIAYFFKNKKNVEIWKKLNFFEKKRYTRYNETTNWIKNTKKEPRPVKAWETLTASLNWLPPIN